MIIDDTTTVEEALAQLDERNAVLRLERLEGGRWRARAWIRGGGRDGEAVGDDAATVVRDVILAIVGSEAA